MGNIDIISGNPDIPFRQTSQSISSTRHGTDLDSAWSRVRPITAQRGQILAEKEG
jgi:hypothetical protein